MAYIGKEPAIGNFVKLDAISTSSTNTYNLTLDSVAFTPESANHMLVSLNGVIQAPLTSFSVSGSTITFLPSSGTLSSSDSIDFIMVYGNVLDIGTPSDSTVTNAKTNFVSTSSAAGLQIKGDSTTAGTLQLNCEQNSHGVKLRSPAHSSGQSYTLTLPTGNVTADKFLKVASVSGSGTTGIGQLSFDDAGESNTPAWNVYKNSAQSLAGDTNTLITFDSELVDTDSAFSSNKFTVPSGKGGDYFYYANFRHTYGSDRQITLKLYKNGSMTHQILGRTNSYGMNFHGIISLSASDYLELYYILGENPVSGSIDSGQDNTKFGGFRIKS
tara:strand:+ start:84 stop:1067 length:984 start_codon:yes stop_codon:yes gene_type:complete